MMESLTINSGISCPSWTLYIYIYSDVNQQDDGRDTPLHVATNSQTVKRLLAAGANVNSRNRKEKTPLHTQQSGRVSSSTDSTRMLLDGRANVNARDNRNKTALHYSVDIHVPVNSTRLLLESGADPNARAISGETPLLLCVKRAHWIWWEYSVLQALIQNGSISNSSRSFAAKAQLLLEKGADPTLSDQDGATPLGTAVRCTT